MERLKRSIKYIGGDVSDLLYRLSSMPPSQNLSRDAIAEILNLQKQKEELEDRLEHEVEIIECAAQDEINRLTKELETTKKLLDEAVSMLTSASEICKREDYIQFMVEINQFLAKLSKEGEI